MNRFYKYKYINNDIKYSKNIMYINLNYAK